LSIHIISNPPFSPQKSQARVEGRSAQLRKGREGCSCGHRDDDGQVKNPATLEATAMQQEEQEQEQEQAA